MGVSQHPPVSVTDHLPEPDRSTKAVGAVRDGFVVRLMSERLASERGPPVRRFVEPLEDKEVRLALAELRFNR